MAAYTAIDNPELYFQTKTYSGSSSDVTVTFDGSEDMQPDWVWLKSKASGDHLAYDSVRGTNKRLQPNATDAEVDRSSNNDELKSFNSDGWTLGTFNSNVTGAGNSCVSWNWKSGASFSNDASATGVGSIDSSGIASSDSGLSIFTFTSTGSASTIAHNLGSAPDLYIIKKRNSTGSWFLYTTVIDASLDRFIMNADNAKGDDSNTVPSSTVITSDNGSASDTMVCYAFASKQGFSKFGSYTGNGNADGTFVYTGFRPAWVMQKRSDTSGQSWSIFDNKREGYNVDNDPLYADTSDAEATTDALDFLSNGFKIRANRVDLNNSGSTYIYMAFAEAPFVNSNGVPCNAR